MYEVKRVRSSVILNQCGEVSHIPNNLGEFGKNLADFGEVIHWIRHFCSADE